MGVVNGIGIDVVDIVFRNYFYDIDYFVYFGCGLGNGNSDFGFLFIDDVYQVGDGVFGNYFDVVG